jgi:hypothetical protein
MDSYNKHLLYNRYKREKTKESSERLGDTLSGLMDNQILVRQAKLKPVAQLWNEILPVELRQHCIIADISGGQLNVLADSSSYKYNLQLCTTEILAELQRRCSKVRIKRINIALA